MSVLATTKNPLEILGSDLVNWFDASQVNGVGVVLPADNSDVLVWKNLTGLADYGKGVGRSNRSPKFILKEDGRNAAVRFTRGTSTTAVDTDQLALLNSLTVSTYLSYMVVSKRTSNQDLQGIVSPFGGGTNGIHVGEGSVYSSNNRARNNFRFSTYLNTKCLITYAGNTSIRKIKVGGSALVSQSASTSLGLGLGMVGGYGYDNDAWTGSFSVFNPRNFDGWIYEVIAIEGDILDFSNIGKLKALEAYFNLKYNL